MPLWAASKEHQAVTEIEVLEDDCEECYGIGCDACEGLGSVAEACQFCGCVIPVYPDAVQELEDADGFCTCEVCDAHETPVLMESFNEPGFWECPVCRAAEAAKG